MLTTCFPVGGTLYKLKLLSDMIVEHILHTVSCKGAKSLRPRLSASFYEALYQVKLFKYFVYLN